MAPQCFGNRGAGARVTMIESAAKIGGTCVNVGCVPSKIQIRAAQLAENQRSNPFSGLANHEPVVDRAALVEQQQRRVAELRQSKYQSILDENPLIQLRNGRAKLLEVNTVNISHTDGSEEQLFADNILIATGASPAMPTIAALDDTPYWTSTEALISNDSPEHLIIIGSSVVAVEQAQAFHRLGSRVTLLGHHLLSRETPELSKGLTEAFRDEDIEVHELTEATEVCYEKGTFRL